NKTMSVYTAEYDQYNGENKPDDFRGRTITVNIVRDPKAQGLPTTIGGTLTTYRLSTDDTFTRQEYRPRNGSNTYVRTSNTDGVWGRWSSFSDYILLDSDSVKSTST